MPVAETRPDAVGFGILATGGIATAFAADLAHVPAARVTAIGSRSGERARAFADRHGVATAHDSYDAVLADPAVDVVYVATPHALHEENVLAALGAGKAVLCEKPLGLTALQTDRMVAAARAAGLFLAEAMWMRCNPTLLRMVAAVQDGWVGDITGLRADLGFVAPPDPTSRLRDPVLGASALLDVGIYPVALASWLLGEPDTVTGAAVLDERGVDDSAGLVLTYASGAVATLSCSQRGWTDCTATVAGSSGRIEVAPRLHAPPSVTRFGPGWPAVEGETIAEPLTGSGLAHEAIEVVRCVRAGETESPLLPLDETRRVARVLDRARRACGVRLAVDDTDR